MDTPVISQEQQELERFRVLVEASKLINSSIEPGKVYSSILSVARGQLGVERGTLYFLDEHSNELWAQLAPEEGLDEIRLPMGQGVAGWVAATGEEVILHDASIDPRFDPSLDLRTGFRTRSMLCVPIRNRTGKIVGVLQLLNKKTADFGQGDLEFLGSVSDHMAIAMENATLHRAMVVKERMERDLKLGREIQSRLLAPPPSVPGTRIQAACRPCYEVGGDYYDFLLLPNGDLGLSIGDVSGKGVSAALVMSSLQAALRIAAPMEPDLARLAQRLNVLMLDTTQGRKHVTLFLGLFRPSTGELHYVNAGHDPPLLLHDGTCELLAPTGMAIGLLEEATYHVDRAWVPPGGVLFLYTDGLTEASNPDDEQFGSERLRAAAWAALREPQASMTDSVLDAVTRFEEGAPPYDDKTLVVMERTG